MSEMGFLNRTKGPCLGEGFLCYSIAPRAFSGAHEWELSLLRASHSVGLSRCSQTLVRGLR